MAVITVDIQRTGALNQTLERAFRDFEREANAAVDAEAREIEQKFKRGMAEQTALSQAEIDRGVKVRRRGRYVQIIASADPVPLSRYPHRKTKDGVAVQVNPGQYVDIKHARIRGDNIIFFEPGGKAKTLYGPGHDQIARTEFPKLAEEAKIGLLRRLRRR